ncbi:protein-methionine-sulfoxide reductase heme-binding subunit MsrQ [Ovoidimarina sediminis]|uniref:protein-methionine-sulfoxide reductase heme-binding subunit MsrQ n=1 Tax=Ovoidimarina sediminis TaxID=3079856 RepID=UPI00290FA3B9|nr:protein-methionine-sulfoxide reductase heme-binding subunit MsrQ [Rhodophyticola sp. MJ-SS7]MDU8943886.1 protein-methionine-sulfoxide reductase heme-binding subunit MsrQ [Rhodophyticola sp. MJ-SS7]
MTDLVQNVNGALRRVPTWPVYLIGALPPLWWFYQGLTGGLGPEPIKTFEHLLGELGLQMLIATLAVTPLRRFTGVTLLKFRRALGLLAFYYITCHLLVWLVLDVQILSEIWKDILKRPYITIGMAGFLLLVPLALTSNNLSVRRLSAPRWRRLHQLSYLAAVLGAVHFVMLAKTWRAEPLVYLAIVLVLLLARVRARPKRAPA